MGHDADAAGPTTSLFKPGERWGLPLTLLITAFAGALRGWAGVAAGGRCDPLLWAMSYQTVTQM
jgi:hypothetical protein